LTFYSSIPLGESSCGFKEKVKIITNPKILKLKGLLFLFLGVISSTMLMMIVADWTVAVLLAISVWAFARFYYFAFYVLQHYADREFRYSGLLDLVRYLLTQKRK
jgi:hypothetical protein